MCIIEKVFRHEETDLPIIKYKDEIWIKAVAVATILRYENTMKSILNHVDPEDKRKLSELRPKSKQKETFPLEKNEKNTIYINESGLYSLTPISTGGLFHPLICFWPVTFLFLSQFPPNLVTFPKI